MSIDKAKKKLVKRIGFYEIMAKDYLLEAKYTDYDIELALKSCIAVLDDGDVVYSGYEGMPYPDCLGLHILAVCKYLKSLDKPIDYNLFYAGLEVERLKSCIQRLSIMKSGVQKHERFKKVKGGKEGSYKERRPAQDKYRLDRSLKISRKQAAKNLKLHYSKILLDTLEQWIKEADLIDNFTRKRGRPHKN